MNAVEIYEKAESRLNRNEITVGEFEEQIAVLKDVAPVTHGRWVQIGYDKAMDRITCSCCMEYWNIIENNTETFNYCPNCGAKMDGDGQ